MFPQKFLFSITLLRLFLPTVFGLTFSNDDSASRFRNLPEYSEYMRRLGLNRATTSSTTTTTTHRPFVGRQQDSPFSQQFGHFPSIQLCKETPAEGDIYGHIFCWGMFFLYILLVVSLVIYQLRSLIWLKVKAQKKQPTIQEKKSNFEEFSIFSMPDGYLTNKQNSGGKPADEKSVPRMLSL